MEPSTINDPVFGEMSWERLEFSWRAEAQPEDVGDFGSDLPDPAMRRRSSILVRPPGAVLKQPPADEQREAWQHFVGNRQRIISAVMDRALAAYVRQRPTRLYWWERMYGADDPLLPGALPDLSTVEELRKIVRPMRFRVYELREGQSPPTWIGIHFHAGWGNFGVMLRGGEVVDFGDAAMFETLPKTDLPTDLPPFGALRSHQGTVWSGKVHFEPFTRFRNLAEHREQFAAERQTEFERSVLPWDFAEGNFELEFVSPEEGQASPAQVEAFTQFMADPQRSGEQVLSAIFDYYQSVADSYRSAYDSDSAEQFVPVIDSPERLRDLITFQTMTIETPSDDGPAFIGLSFDCSWEQEHGLGVRWRDGKVEEVGTADILY